MKKVIEAIRGVMGVSGVMLWEKHANVFHKLLPARFSSGDVDLLSARVINLSMACGKVRDIKSRFRSGWMWFHDRPGFALLILTKSDLNTTTLNLVLKTSLSTLDTQIRIPDSQPITTDHVQFTVDHVVALSRAINLSLGFFQGEVSRFEIAEILRRAKTQLIEQYPALRHFSVDANGGIIVIRGAEKILDIDSVPAAAQLIATFLKLIGARTSTLTFDIEKLTLGIQPLLAEIGFYNYFISARRSVAQQ